MQFVICAIVVYQDVWVSASDLRFLKRHYGGQIVKKNSIVNKCCFISKMYFSCWECPGVSKRMWSVNLEASISGEYETLVLGVLP